MKDQLKSALAELVISKVKEYSSQAAAAQDLDTTQPRLSSLMNRQLHKFSIDFLVELNGRLGHRMEVQEESGKLSVVFIHDEVI